MNQLENENVHNKIRQECWDQALDSFALAYIYKIRRAKLRTLLTIVTFLGVVVPILIGAMVTNYGASSVAYKWAVAILTPVALVQLVVSLWALISKWSDSSDYYSFGFFYLS